MRVCLNFNVFDICPVYFQTHSGPHRPTFAPCSLTSSRDKTEKAFSEDRESSRRSTISISDPIYYLSCVGRVPEWNKINNKEEALGSLIETV